MKRQMTYLTCVLSVLGLISVIPTARANDADAIADLSKGITEWQLLNENKTEAPPERQVYVSSALRHVGERVGGGDLRLVSGLAAFDDDKPYDFLRYINRRTSRDFPVDTLGRVGGMGTVPLPGERIYVNVDDPFSYAPATWRNVKAIPTHRSATDPVYAGESGVGWTIFWKDWGRGSPQKIYGTGGHSRISYESIRGPLTGDRITAHSQGSDYLTQRYVYGGGYKAVERFRGQTILGAGHGPLDAGKNQIATGGYGDNFARDVGFRGLPASLGIPVGNPLRVESNVGRRDYGTRVNSASIGSTRMSPPVSGTMNYPPPEILFSVKDPLTTYTPSMPRSTIPSYSHYPTYKINPYTPTLPSSSLERRR